jgi:hypothetical protein
LAFDISQNLSSLTWEIVVGELDVQVVIHVGNYEDNIGRGRIGKRWWCGERDRGIRHIDG